MKKILLISLVLIIVLVGGAFGYLAMNANSLIASNKAELERLASEAVGSKVELGDISLSVFPSINVNVSEFKLSKNKSNEQLSLKDLKLNLSLIDLLFGTVKIKNLSLADPTILLIKDSKGIRVAGLPEAKEKKAAPAAPAKDAGVKKESAPSPIGVDLESLSITGITVRLKNATTGKEGKISKINLSTGIKLKGETVSVKGLSIDGSLLDSGKISLSGNISEFGSDKEKIKLKGGITKINLAEITNLTTLLETALPIEGSGAIGINFDVSGSSAKPVAEGSINLTDAKVAKPAVFSKEAGVPLTLNFSAKPDKENLTFSTSVNGDQLALVSPPTTLTNINIGLQAQGNSKTQVFEAFTDSLALNLGGAPIRGKIEANMRGAEVNLKTLHIDAFNGAADGTARHNTTSGALGLDFAATTLDLGMILGALNPAVPAPFAGTLSSLNLNISTSLKTDPAAALGGKGALKMVNGKLVGSNIAGEVIQQLAALPFFPKDFMNSLSPADKEALAKKETDIKQLSASFIIGNKKINTNDFILESSLFSLTAAGQVGFDADMNLRCKMILNKTLSALIVAKVKELKTTLSPQGNVTLEVTITGKAPNLKITPDMGNLLKAGLAGAASKFLGGGKDGQGAKGLKGLLKF